MNTPQQPIADFIAKWGPGGAAFGLNEEQGAQQHFIELCAVLGVPAPAGGDDYVFEKGALVHAGQRRGYADVFKRGHFAWENKAPGKPLDAALRQLMTYALALDNPPLLVVSDRAAHRDPHPLQRHAERAPRRHARPSSATRPSASCCAAASPTPSAFARRAPTARSPRRRPTPSPPPPSACARRGIAAETASHLLTQCLFCFFAEDVGLLPARLFERLVGNRDAEPEALRRGLHGLFTTMRDGGLFGADSIAWFNGGLFAQVEVPPLTRAGRGRAARRRRAGLERDRPRASSAPCSSAASTRRKRSQLGAHYTDPATIMRLVEPVVAAPAARRVGSASRRVIAAHIGKSRSAPAMPSTARANGAFVGFLERLRGFRVLDPACGSGNFLYLALKALKDIEHQANIEAEALGLQRQVDAYTSPANVLGIEINEYAAELARVTVWIGELQWRLQHGYPFKREPDARPAGPDRVPRRADERRWQRGAVAEGRCRGRQPAVRRRQEDARASWATPTSKRCAAAYAGRVPGGADLVVLLVREGAARRSKRHGLRAPAWWRPTRFAAGPTARCSTRIVRRQPHLRRVERRGRGSTTVRRCACRWCASAMATGARLDGAAVPQIYADLTAPAEAGDSI